MVKPIFFCTDGAVITFKGEVTADEVITTNKALLSHSEFDKQRFAIWDYRCVESISYEKSQIVSLANQDNLESWKNPNRQIALVTKKALFFGLARMYEAYYGDGPWDIRVFYSMNEAAEWVGFSEVS